MHHPIKCCCKKISTSVNLAKSVISDYMSPNCDPELEDSKPNKMLSDLEDIVWTNTDILTLYCDPSLECSKSISFTRHSGL